MDRLEFELNDDPVGQGVWGIVAESDHDAFQLCEDDG